MARIRTIKPEFWTDERLAECSITSRLLFIGMLNFADDNGNLVYSAKRLKMQVFPADMVDTQPLLDELLAHGLLIEYAVSNCAYLHIKGFSKHQVINRRTKSPIPQPEFIEQASENNDQAGNNEDDSLSAHGGLTDGKEKEKEGKGEERETREVSRSRPDRSKTLTTYIADCKAQGVKPIPDGHSIRAFMADSGISDDMAQIAWIRFREEHLTGARKAKRYVDWPATFANSVKDRWYRLWTVPAEGDAQWTSEGHQARRAIEAAHQQHTQEAA